MHPNKGRRRGLLAALRRLRRIFVCQKSTSDAKAESISKPPEFQDSVPSSERIFVCRKSDSDAKAERNTEPSKSANNVPSIAREEREREESDNRVSVPPTEEKIPTRLGRSSLSSGRVQQSTRWTEWAVTSHRRRNGFHCMRLRIAGMVRLLAMVRKVRVAYRGMIQAAAESNTTFSLADFRQYMADLNPMATRKVVDEFSKPIVLIRPIKCLLNEDEPTGNSLRTTRYYELEKEAGEDHSSLSRISRSGHSEASWRKIDFPSFRASSFRTNLKPCSDHEMMINFSFQRLQPSEAVH